MTTRAGKAGIISCANCGALLPMGRGTKKRQVVCSMCGAKLILRPIDEDVFREIEEYAKKHNLAPDQVVGLAIEELKRYVETKSPDSLKDGEKR